MAEELFKEGEVEKPTPQSKEAPAKSPEAPEVSTPNPLEAKLEGDQVPEELRGKKVSDILGELDKIRKDKETLEAEKSERVAKETVGEAKGGETADKPMTYEELQQLSYTDPLKASALLFQTLSQPLVKEFRGMAERTAKSEVIGRKDWNRFQPEVDALMGKMDPSARSNPEAWKGAYNQVRGQHVDELLSEASHGSTGFVPTGAEPPKPEVVPLTPEEKEVILKMGVDEKEYIKNKTA